MGAKGNPKKETLKSTKNLQSWKKGQILTIMVIMAIFDFSFGIKFNCG
jgi:hypothetical protein